MYTYNFRKRKNDYEQQLWLSLLHYGDEPLTYSDSEPFCNDDEDEFEAEQQPQLVFGETFPERYQYSKEKKILILGEMDFSLALSIVKQIGNEHQVICTSYHTAVPSLCGDEFNQNVRQLKQYKHEQLKKDFILRGIDATKLKRTLRRQKRTVRSVCTEFDCVIFGLPRHSEDNDENRDFIEKILQKYVMRYVIYINIDIKYLCILICTVLYICFFCI